MATALVSSTEDPRIELHSSVDHPVNTSRRPPQALPMVPSWTLFSDPHRRSVTLGRGENLPVKSNVGRRSDFTRVRRMNTFKCVVKKPSHPPVKAKALSLNFGMKFDGSNASNYTDPPVAVDPVAKDESPVFNSQEVQEVILTFVAAPLSSTSTTSTSSEASTQEEALPIVSTPTSAIPTGSAPPNGCPICKGELSSHDALVIFGNATLHLKCFKCGKCHQPMGNIQQFLVQVDGTPLCEGCTPACHICHGKIFQNHVSVLKKDFHEDCLACARCRRKFSLLTKIYANNGEPCCASCITPVFNEIWSPLKTRTTSSRHSHSSLPISRRTSNGSSRKATMTLSPSPSTDSGVSDSASNDGLSEQILHGITNCDLNPRLESLSRSIASYSSNGLLRMRTSFSAPNLSNGVVTNLQKLSLSSLKDILYDETGSLLFLCHCVSQCAVELVAFWLDVEHFKHFDGGDDDLKIFAHHIVLKYIGYFAEIPVPLPKDIQSDIFESMELSVSPTIFNEAQHYILHHMEREILPGFLNSQEGKNYIESIVERELQRMKKKTPNSSAENLTLNITRAQVTNFDKRYMETKFYVYEVEVHRADGSTYTIYRRYSEWYNLNQRLRKAFPKESFPRLPKKIFLRRSQVRAVAEERMKQLQFYLQGLFVLRPEVLNCKVLGDFLMQTQMDKEDEQFNKKITELQRKKSS